MRRHKTKEHIDVITFEANGTLWTNERKATGCWTSHFSYAQ